MSPEFYPEWLRAATCDLRIVFGPPGSGKSSHVAAHALPDHKVIDLDEIRSELSGLPLYVASSKEWLLPAIRARNERLSVLQWADAQAVVWFIVSGAGKARRDWWTSKLQPRETILLDTPHTECAERIRADSRRAHAVATHLRALAKWFAVELSDDTLRISHAPRRTDRTSDKRTRGRGLQRIRQAHFRAHPLCVHCDRRGIVTLATELDHIVALNNGGLDVASNRQGLCGPCHAIKTAADLGHKVSGCDANGMPIDPRHPWNQP